MVREPANHIRGKSWKHWGCLAKQRQHWRQSQERQGRTFSLTNVRQGPFLPGDLTKSSKNKTKRNKNCAKHIPWGPNATAFLLLKPRNSRFSDFLSCPNCPSSEDVFQAHFRSAGIPHERVLDRRVGMGSVEPQCVWKAVSANACQSTRAWWGSAKTSCPLVIAGFRTHRRKILLEKPVTDLFHHNFGIISTV